MMPSNGKMFNVKLVIVGGALLAQVEEHATLNLGSLRSQSPRAQAPCCMEIVLKKKIKLN